MDRALASGGDVSAQARAIAGLFDSEIRDHFHFEEQILFPALAAFPAIADLITELVAEHRHLRMLVDSIRPASDRSAVDEFSKLLQRHVRKEEAVLFEEAQRLLSREELDRIGELHRSR